MPPSHDARSRVREDHSPPFLTAEELLARGEQYPNAELVRGRLRVTEPASGGHGMIVGALFAALQRFVEERGLGVCFPDNVGFVLPGLPHTVRSPDVAFIRADRVPAVGFGGGFVPLAPDLVAEVLSPQETPAVLHEKLRDYREAGTRLLWVLDPESRTIAIHQANAAERRIVESDTLDGGAIVPGFTVPVAQLFARFARQTPAEHI